MPFNESKYNILLAPMANAELAIARKRLPTIDLKGKSKDAFTAVDYLYSKTDYNLELANAQNHLFGPNQVLQVISQLSEGIALTNLFPEPRKESLQSKATKTFAPTLYKRDLAEELKLAYNRINTTDAFPDGIVPGSLSVNIFNRVKGYRYFPAMTSRFFFSNGYVNLDDKYTEDCLFVLCSICERACLDSSYSFKYGFRCDGVIKGFLFLPKNFSVDPVIETAIMQAESAGYYTIVQTSEGFEVYSYKHPRFPYVIFDNKCKKDELAARKFLAANSAKDLFFYQLKRPEPVKTRGSFKFTTKDQAFAAFNSLFVKVVPREEVFYGLD